MNCIEICSLPEFNFAHSYEANSYKNNFITTDNKIEISYMSEGESSITVDGKTYNLKKGDVCCNIFNKPIRTESNTYHCHHTVCASVKYKCVDNDSNGLYIPYIVPCSKMDDEIKKGIDSFVYSPHIYENSATKTAALFLNILCKIDEVARKENNLNQHSSEVLTYKAKKNIYNNINSPITQREIAEHLGVSAEYLCNVFKRNEGMAVMKYINTIKLKNIRILMTEKNLKLYEAASVYGYSDANYVSKLHKIIFGYNITELPNVYNKNID